ncbi:hypothetical protein [Microbacterium sp. SS28]|uniref:hypothetical protein n=1 Tax=Microbacterium sp. SS28 TaxID=2919948 RepID=UPI001FAAC390|nr:hypothetical protein [Microbacterium sp. SS28]
MTTASPVAGARAAAPSERTLESIALAVGVASFIVVALVAVIAFRFQPAPIAGPNSVGQFAAVTSALVAVVAFAGGRMLAGGVRPGILDIVDLVALSFAHAVIALLSWTLVSVIFEQAFIGAEVFAIPVILLSGAVAAVTGYVAFFSGTHIDLQLLAVILATFLVEGIVASMLTASDPLWWQEHLSSLGVTGDVSSLAFNLTLIVAGVLVTTLARAATAGIPTDHPKGVARVRLSLILVGVFLAFVGVFPVDDWFWIHTAFASGMAVVYGVLVVRLPVWITGMSRFFVYLGWVFLAVVVALGVFYAIGYYTLTAVELVAGTLVFTWIILFIRSAAALQEDLRPQE